MKKEIKFKIIILIINIICGLLMCLPYGIIMKFSGSRNDGSMEYLYISYSYLSDMVYGYALFTPILSFILNTGVLILDMLSILIKTKILYLPLRIISLICFILSIGHYILGIDCISILSIVITILLLINTLIIHLFLKEKDITVNN